MSIKGLWSGIPSLDIFCLALILNLSNLWMTILHRFKVAKSLLAWIWWVISRLSWQIDMNSLLLVEASCSESGNMGLISAWCWNFLQPLGHFTWRWARQWHSLFYIAALCTTLCKFQVFPLDFHQWQSRAHRGLTLNMSIQLPLFGSTPHALCQDSATCAGLAHRQWS